MTREHRNEIWSCTGPIRNWKIGLEYFDDDDVGIWGVREKLESTFNDVRVDDYIVFKVESPVSGLVGHGRVTTPDSDIKEPIWPEDREEHLTFQHRFTFRIGQRNDPPWEVHNFEFTGMNGYRSGIKRVADPDTRQEILAWIRDS